MQRLTCVCSPSHIPVFPVHPPPPCRNGRATYFGTDAWSIHKGNCGLGDQFEDVYPGFHVLAPSDQSSPFAGSCGKCFELKCRQEPYTDGYDNWFDNSNQCHNTSESLVARVVDACPCDYPGNAYSNKRWCCQDKGAGDMHADISVWAFEKLGRKGPGSMALSFREVPCNYLPENPAYVRDYEGETWKDYPPKSARRPHEWTFISGRNDWLGKTQGSVHRVSDPESAWAPIVDGSHLYRDGTYNLSYKGPFEYLTERVVELFGETFFDKVEEEVVEGPSSEK
jgi:hypothetical protein